MYLVTIGLFSILYAVDLKSVPESVLFSVDTLACRGRMSETDHLGNIVHTDLTRWASVCEAIIGHLIPSFVFGLLLVVFAEDRT